LLRVLLNDLRARRTPPLSLEQIRIGTDNAVSKRQYIGEILKGPKVPSPTVARAVATALRGTALQIERAAWLAEQAQRQRSAQRAANRAAARRAMGRPGKAASVPAPGHSVVPTFAIESQDSGLLFARAVEQLGSDKATVRIGGLYVLERVADENVGQAQRIVDLICGYLRMPFTRPGPVVGPKPSQQQAELWEQEHQVRAVAQRILSEHLQPPADDDQVISENLF
jgi:hypothetical protein